MLLEKNEKYALQTHETDATYFFPYGKLRDLNMPQSSISTYCRNKTKNRKQYFM